MIELEALEVWSIDDGAEGRVVLEWVERSTAPGVPARAVSLVIAESGAHNLAQRITEAIDAE